LRSTAPTAPPAGLSRCPFGRARLGSGLHQSVDSAHRCPIKSAGRLSIIILPFTNLSNDPKQEYFADGITDDLTTDLSRIAGSFVIARSTAFTYRGA
jgi:TolB-like protein